MMQEAYLTGVYRPSKHIIKAMRTHTYSGSNPQKRKLTNLRVTVDTIKSYMPEMSSEDMSRAGKTLEYLHKKEARMIRALNE